MVEEQPGVLRGQKVSGRGAEGEMVMRGGGGSEAAMTWRC